EYWLAPAGRTSAAGIYGEYHPAKAKVAKMGAFTYVLPNVSTWSEIDQKYMRPARDAALEGKKTPKQALDEVTSAAQRLLDEANKYPRDRGAPPLRLVVRLRPADVRAVRRLHAAARRPGARAVTAERACHRRRVHRHRELRDARGGPGLPAGAGEHDPVHDRRRRGAGDRRARGGEPDPTARCTEPRVLPRALLLGTRQLGDPRRAC